MSGRSMAKKSPNGKSVLADTLLTLSNPVWHARHPRRRKMRNYASVRFSDVRITGRFWGERLDCVLTHTIPSQHRQLAAHGILDSVKLPQD